MSEEEPKLPSLIEMAKNFSKDFAKYVASGAPNVSKKDYEERLEACGNCVYFIKDRMRCGKCGCLIEHKAKWKTAICPDIPPKWKPQIIKRTDKPKDGKKQENDNTSSSNEI